MGDVERAIRDRAADTLAELTELEVRPMFSGFGFYVGGLLVAAAWDGAFRLRHRRDGHWHYDPVAAEVLDDPAALVLVISERAAALGREPNVPRGRAGRAQTGIAGLQGKASKT